MNRLNLHYLQQGARGRIVELYGGRSFIHKLNSMGLREGKEITVISDSFLEGPVTIKIDNIKLAIGHGMASRIIVEVL